MKLLQKISEDEMIAIFLKAEIDSPRFRGRILNALEKHLSTENVIKQADTSNSSHNALRKSILAETRGFGTNSALFSNFPSDVEWYRSSIGRVELGDIKYIFEKDYVALSDKTRLVKIAVKNIREGRKIFNGTNEPFINIIKKINARLLPPEIILVGKDIKNLVVLEGHTRITAYVLAGSKTPKYISVVVGISDRIEEWKFYSQESYNYHS